MRTDTVRNWVFFPAGYRLKKNRQISDNDVRTIKDMEIELAKLTSKTVNIDKYKVWLREKLNYNDKSSQLYHEEVFRLLKYRSYMNIKKSEQKMINNFKKKYGGIKLLLHYRY